jgi:hypothetical protein
MEVTKEQTDFVSDHNQQIGFLCSQWSFLESLVEIALWWLLGLPPKEGRIITGGLNICDLARKVRDLAHLKVSAKADLDALTDLAAGIENVEGERNLAVHGLREVRPGDKVMATVTRGKYRNTPQPISLIRLKTRSMRKSLNWSQLSSCCCSSTV